MINIQEPPNILRCFENYIVAVDKILRFNQLLWDMSFDSSFAATRKREDFLVVYFPNLEEYEKYNNIFDSETLQLVLLKLKEKKLISFEKKGKINFSESVFNPYKMLHALLADQIMGHNLWYYLMQNIRHEYDVVFSTTTTRYFQILSVEATKLLSKKNSNSGEKSFDGKNIDLDYFLESLEDFLEGEVDPPNDSRLIARLYFDCCRAVNYIGISEYSQKIYIRTLNFDSEYLISNLFGLSTGIRGLDKLFGGGGLILPERATNTKEGELGGRTLLIKGPSGTGKTLLALQLAVEVAKKGGIAWMMPLEQKPEECLYMLESMGVLRGEPKITVAIRVSEAISVLSKDKSRNGTLIILRSIKDSFKRVLEVLQENSNTINSFPLQLICLDPVNSVVLNDSESVDETTLRAQMIKSIETIKSTGCNLMLVAEEHLKRNNGLTFIENIADSVINLSVEDRNNYSQRFFEITKSRLQRELRGEHPFSIKSGVGITISPSSTAVRGRIRNRAIFHSEEKVSLGNIFLDEGVLGTGAILENDVIVFQGPGGSLKTPLGISFLLNREFKNKSKCSLIVSARSGMIAVRSSIENFFGVSSLVWQNYSSNLEICSLPQGYISPGFVFEELQRIIFNEKLKGRVIDRVMVDNISHWEVSSPFIRDDETFGYTLAEFFRRHNMTSLMICSDNIPGSTSMLQRAIVNNADCHIQFDRFNYRGKKRVSINVVKSRSMKHSREAFEIKFEGMSLDFRPMSSLLRLSPDGELKPIKARMILDLNTSIQKRYYSTVLRSIRAVLSTGLKIESLSNIYLNSSLTLGKFSSVEELQVLQIDDARLKHNLSSKKRDSSFHKMPYSEFKQRLSEDFLSHIQKELSHALSHDKSYYAIPMYCDIGLLCYQKDSLKMNSIQSWKNIANECMEWEKTLDINKDNRLFFDFPKRSSLDYVSLFFEILFSLENSASRKRGYSLKSLLRGKEVKNALKIFWILCHRAHRKSINVTKKPTTRTDFRRSNDKVEHLPIVCRHWYSTLNDFYVHLPLEKRNSLAVNKLPGQPKATFARDWYLCIPSYSAAPDIGIKIIKILTSPEAEQGREMRGVGLPVRTKFYDMKKEKQFADFISPYFTFDQEELRKIVNEASRPSFFVSFLEYSNIFAFHLKWLLEFDLKQPPEIDRFIENILDSLILKTNLIK